MKRPSLKADASTAALTTVMTITALTMARAVDNLRSNLRAKREMTAYIAAYRHYLQDEKERAF